MSWGYVAVGVGTAVAGYLGSEATKDAAKTVGKGADQAVAEYRRQFDLMQEMLAPYAEGGEEALNVQKAFLGLAGPEAERAAIQQIERSPELAALTRQGEEAILQNAAATGGVRGGNVQGALAQFRPQLLNELIQRRYGQLAGLTSLGQSSAAMTGTAGMTSAGQIGGTLTQAAGQLGGLQLARGQIAGNTFGNIAGLIAANRSGGGATSTQSSGGGGGGGLLGKLGGGLF